MAKQTVKKLRTGSIPKGKGTRLSKILEDRPDWIDDPEFKGTVGPYNPRKKVYRPKKKKTTTKTKRTKVHAFGIDPLKDKAKRKDKKKVTGKRPRHGPGTYGPATYGDAVPKGKVTVGTDISKIRVPPRKPPIPTRTITVPPRKPPVPDRRKLDVDFPLLGVGHGAGVTTVRNTAEDNARRAREAAEKAELAAAEGRARAKEVEERKRVQRSAQLSSEAEQRNLAATQLRDQKRNRERVLAERAAKRTGKEPPKLRWPGALQRRVSTKDKGVLETGRLEGKPVERTPKQKHQDSQALKRLVEKYGGKIRDYWNAAQNRPLSDAEARAKKGLDETKRQVRSSDVGLSAVEQYKGGQPKKKKKKSTSKRVKSKHSGYQGHDGNKLVAKFYD